MTNNIHTISKYLSLIPNLLPVDLTTAHNASISILNTAR
jgi:hypothetical protein